MTLLTMNTCCCRSLPNELCVVMIKAVGMESTWGGGGTKAVTIINTRGAL